MTADRTAALVLAGGQARRMGGGDKPLLTVGDRTMLACVIAALDVPDIAISANDSTRFASFGLPVLSDGGFVGQGPLAGVLAGMQWAAALGMTALLTAPGDTPFLPRGFGTCLVPAPSCVSSGGRLHPLIALWPTSCASTLRDLLSEGGSRSVAHFADRIGMRHTEFGTGTEELFANINTPNDLAEARSRMIAVRSG